MRWFDRNSFEEDVLTEAKNQFGLIKRTDGTSIIPMSPPRRPFTSQELKALKENFGDAYHWSDIDRDGKIVLFDKHKTEKIRRGFYFITEEDLKQEIERSKIR